MGTRSSDMHHEEELHWKQSLVSMQHDAIDVYNANNFSMALEATVQVSLVKTCLSPEMYDVCI